MRTIRMVLFGIALQLIGTWSSISAFAEQPSAASPPASRALASATPTPEANPVESTAANAEGAGEPWKVSDPHGPTYEASIDVTEGTWMSLDVSPDGREIVFDLLGDIYSIPIAGGDAHNLTHGIEWDMQPTFSPDGRRIAFTSDRSGGDNVWTMNRDGSDPRPVSKETFRLLNSPVWEPSGEYIVARKHFTDTRSLGAGEMWLYHRSGGEGLQMTKRPNDQKDAGEPAFSPDGRYVYFSQDTTPGKRFEYNKDPNKQIYVIQRLDRETGEVEPFVTGEGGAVRPTPSPDGKYLAFVRRIRYKSTLHLIDLKSGKITPLYDGLDRDLQETWAVHGVYPRMAWTPDSRSIVFWAGGKIRRLDIGTRRLAEIPFHIVDKRAMTRALRFPHQVAPGFFDVKMLRWVQVSPRGDQVAYQALGHIWIRDLPNGTPRRLTRQNEAFEFYPSYSRDGRWIVYTVWNDQILGSVRLASSRGGEGTDLTLEPGHYVEPRFSPDGNAVVFRKIEGGFLRTPTWSWDPGIYIVSVKGGRSHLVSKKGVAPLFGSRNDRVFFVTLGENDSRELRSIDLTGKEERTHYRSAKATEMQISPDGKWLAFAEKFNAYVAPFVETGETIDIGAETKSIPVARVSKEAGEYLHWAGDSSRLYWSLGAELFARDLKNAFAFIDGAPEELPDPPLKGTPIGFAEPTDKPIGTIALVGARIVTMKGEETIIDGTIVVTGNRIAEVGPRRSVSIPPDAKRIDVTGKTIIPGLVDVHWHGAAGQDQINPQQDWYFFSSLAFGVTTVHDPSNDTAEIFSASELQRAGLIVGPRIFSTGTILYGARAPFTAEIENLDDARFHLRRMKAVGAISIKSYNQPRRDQRQQVIQAARELGMMVVPEGGSLFEHNMTMVVDGHTGIEHALPVSRLYADGHQLWKQSDVGYTPTLIVAYGGSFGQNYWYEKTNVWENRRLTNFVPSAYVDAASRRRTMIPFEEYNHINVARIATALAREGVSVQIGAHGEREGLGAHWEIWMLGQGGMTPMEALRAATIDGARYLGLDADIGSIESGKLADLVVLNTNPIELLRNSEDILFTMVNGRLYDAMTMNETGNVERPRKRFWFEQ